MSLDLEEQKFRAAERELDHVLARDTSDLVELGVEIDSSFNRPRRYRGEYLAWSYRFYYQWPLQLDTGSVTVIVTCSEPVSYSVDLVVSVDVAIEAFREGQLSIKLERYSKTYSVNEFLMVGVYSLVNEAVTYGKQSLK